MNSMQYSEVETIISSYVQFKNSFSNTTNLSLSEEAEKALSAFKVAQSGDVSQTYQAFLFGQVNLVMNEGDYQFARIDFLIQLMNQQIPSRFSDIYEKLIPCMIQAYQNPRKDYFIKNLIFQFEQLIDLAIAHKALDNQLLPHLHAIAQLEIEEKEGTELQHHHVMKVLEALHLITTTESLEAIVELTQHASWNVRNLAQQILDNHTDLM